MTEKEKFTYQKTQYKPITIRGTTFISQTAAAKHFGISTHTVSNAAKLGREDYIGLGRGYKDGKDAGDR